MSLFGALSAALTSLTAQSRAVNVISNNIANLSTTGFKGTSVSFSTLIAGTVGGGVVDSLRQDISTQGAINSTGINSDLAVQGDGFFVVKDGSGNFRYTRAGSFRTDSQGRLVNEAGYILQGWPLDDNGNIPSTSASTDSLVNISTNDISSKASPTSTITTKMNLKAEQEVLAGATGLVDLASTANSSNNSTDIIVPQSFANGATFTVTNDKGTVTYTYGGIEASANIASGISNATTINQTFTSASGGFVDGDNFTIQTSSMSSPVTFTFQTTSNTNNNEFKNLSELAQIIDATDGLRARIDNGVLYVAADNANDAIDFTNGGGNSTANMIGTLGLADVASGTSRFASLSELANLINTDTSSSFIKATVNSPTSNSTLNVSNEDPTKTILFGSSDADLLTEFGLTSSTIPAVYDALAPVNGGSNMASGGITPDFSRTITVFDSTGSPFNLTLGFVKISETDNEAVWACEVYASDGGSELDSGLDSSGALVSYGTVTFDGNGNLKSVDGPSSPAKASIAAEFNLDPAGLPTVQGITINFGTIGTTDGLSEFAGDYDVQVLAQNGFPTGKLQSLQFDSEGFVTAIFNNSLTSKKYRLPLAVFPNPNGLTAESGNAYSQNINAGEVKLAKVGDAGSGTFVPGSVEAGTSDVGGELTKLIVNQQAYSAATTVLRQVNQLFDDLKRITQ